LESLVATGHFETYQRTQSKPVFNCSYIVSFLGERHSHARLHAAYRVLGMKDDPARKWPANWPCPDMPPGRFWYDLERLPAFDDLSGRVVIDWGASTRAWHQWFSPKEIVEVYPTGYVREFPGYEQILLTHAELKQIIEAPLAHREWHRALGRVAGIYLITDTTSGRQYVGSAYGDEGILGRWKSYAITGHGGNIQLKDALAANPHAFHHWQYSVLMSLPQTLSKDELLGFESLYKRKLGSRAHGLNGN